MTALRLIFVWFLLLAGAVQAQEYNTDRPGRDYRSFPLQGADYRLCEKACEADSACKAFTYTNPGVKGPAPMCFLKSAAPPKTANTCCISGIKPGNAAASVSPPPPPKPTQPAPAPPQGKTAGSDEAACRSYATEAVASARENQRLSCGYKGDRWSVSSRSHFDWCLAAKAEQRTAEKRARQRDMGRCRDTKGSGDASDDDSTQTASTTSALCQDYGRNALRQARLGLSLPCGFAGPRWSRDAKVHETFCERAPPNARNRELSRRTDLIEACQARPQRARDCRRYGNLSVDQQKDNRANHCGYSGSEWSPDYDTHFLWCMGTRRAASMAMLIRRDNLLRQCR